MILLYDDRQPIRQAREGAVDDPARGGRRHSQSLVRVSQAT